MAQPAAPQQVAALPVVAAHQPPHQRSDSRAWLQGGVWCTTPTTTGQESRLQGRASRSTFLRRESSTEQWGRCGISIRWGSLAPAPPQAEQRASAGSLASCSFRRTTRSWQTTFTCSLTMCSVRGTAAYSRSWAPCLSATRAHLGTHPRLMHVCS